jgi:hypothetical protein
LHRLAFEVPSENESSVDDFDQGIQDTIAALSTGALIDRVTCCVLRQGPAISDLSANRNITGMENIVRNLQNLRNEYRMAAQTGDVAMFKRKRAQMLDDFNAIAQSVGVPPLTLILAQHPSFIVDYLNPRSKPVGVERDAEGDGQTTDFV